MFLSVMLNADAEEDVEEMRKMIRQGKLSLSTCFAYQKISGRMWTYCDFDPKGKKPGEPAYVIFGSLPERSEDIELSLFMRLEDLCPSLAE
jgi:hypothetical protein